MEKQKKQRLDVLLVEKGLAPSREKAKAIIMALIVIGITLLQVAITSRKEVQS